MDGRAACGVRIMDKGMLRMDERMLERFVIAAPEATAEKLCGIFAQAQLAPERVCHAGGEVLAAAQQKGSLLLLTTWKLADMSGEELAGELGDAAQVLMIAPKDYEEGGSGAMILHNPVSQDALVQSVLTMAHCRAQIDALQAKVEKLSRTLEERKIIERAKGRLMDQLHLSESEAHYRIQKKSMDTGRRIAEIAQDILAGEDLAS